MTSDYKAESEKTDEAKRLLIPPFKHVPKKLVFADWKAPVFDGPQPAPQLKVNSEADE